MAVYDDVLLAAQSLAQSAQTFAVPSIGPLPPDDGISLMWASSVYNPFFDKLAAVELTAVVNGKSTDQQAVSEALNQIHTTLSMMKAYPQSNNYQITNIETLSAPAYIGREENAQWLYGSSLRVKFYLKGM